MMGLFSGNTAEKKDESSAGAEVNDVTMSTNASETDRVLDSESESEEEEQEEQEQEEQEQEQENNKSPATPIAHPNLSFFAPNKDFDYASATEWLVLDPINNADDRQLLQNKVDPITQEPLIDDEHEQQSPVVQLPCHSNRIPCVMYMDTARRCLSAKSECPTCNYMFGRRVPGSQPSGTMTTSWMAQSCQGHSEHGTIMIEYSFDHGTQGAHHQSPDESYSGTYREAFLPDNEVGRQSLLLLQCAFLRGELFTVGTSLTNGCQNTTVWGSVHQKTSMYGGCHGYPDNGYFTRLQHECAAKGIFAFSAGEELEEAVARTSNLNVRR